MRPEASSVAVLSPPTYLSHFDPKLISHVCPACPVDVDMDMVVIASGLVDTLDTLIVLDVAYVGYDWIDTTIMWGYMELEYPCYPGS
jgi:hypothetical protein